VFRLFIFISAFICYSEAAHSGKHYNKSNQSFYYSVHRFLIGLKSFLLVRCAH